MTFLLTQVWSVWSFRIWNYLKRKHNKERKMLNKKTGLGMLVIALVFGMVLVGCRSPDADDSGDEISWNGHQYRRIDQSKTWTEAKAYCETLGGHLATVTSAGEQAAVYNLVSGGDKNVYWIGGYRLNSDWLWVTGEQWEYTNWAPGEPNNTVGGVSANGVEDSLHIYRISEPDTNTIGKWNDMPNTGYLNFYSLEYAGFVCEWEN
jgi:putative hemolysin